MIPTLLASVVAAFIFGVVLAFAVWYKPPTEAEDQCRTEIEQSYTTYQAGNKELAEEILMNALIATCISEVRDD